MNLSWANQIAKAALKTAQQKIDTVLDIRTDENADQASSSIVLDDPLLTPVPSETLDESSLSNLFAVPDTGQDEPWGSAWGGLPTDSQLIVDSEPNPIRDEEQNNVTHLLDHHSPSSNSSDPLDSNGSPVKTGSEYADIDLHEVDKDNDSTITHEPLLPPHHETSSLAGYHHDETLTVASSDIEVIRNVDAWSISSSRLTNDHVAVPLNLHKAESTAAMEAQLHLAEQRRSDLKLSNDALQKTNVQLQQRVVILNNQQNILKKELEEKKKECEDILEEGKKMSDYSGKQSREIRRLKSELSDLEKVKAERKKYKDEKTQAEETIELQKEELASLKSIIKQLESTADQAKKESSQSVASNEAVQKHIEAQDKRINELEAELKKAEAEKVALLEMNKEITQELEQMHSAQWADRLAGERANENALTVGQDLSEAREQIERLTAQLNSTRYQLETALEQHSSIAETISKANAPLLEELNELKIELKTEQQIAEDCDRKARQAKKESDELIKQIAKLEEKSALHCQSLLMEIESLKRKNTALETEIVNTRKDYQKESNEVNTTLKSYEEKVKELHGELLKAGEEVNSLRRSLKEFKEDNDLMRTEIAELRRREPTPTPPVNSTPIRQNTLKNETSDIPTVSSLPNFPPMAYTFAASGQAAQVELESLSIQYESSLKRIAMLEGEAKRTEKLEMQIKQLQRELKELNHQYYQLLELDGERLEKLEEQAQDVIDLRNLLREQLIAFADAKVREEEEKKKRESASTSSE